jgi:formate hydrogenlyase subunit 6/NADH:ubiquinone oxidoreductase subunit I
MLKKGKPQQNLLPDTDPQTDCQSPENASNDFVSLSEAEEMAQDDDHDHDHDLSWHEVYLEENEKPVTIASWIPQRARWSIFLERIALVVEKPANRLIGTAQLNPFYHTGTIATLLLIIVALTGFFLFLFFQYGFEASYNAVLTRIETPFIARTVRAIHRYASGALVITTLLHAYRTLFMERFRGPRWLAWLTGIVMTVFLWFAGVTGYWLIWDQRSQLINDAFVDFLQTLTPFAASYMVTIAEAASSGNSWYIFLAVFAVHVLLTVIVAAFYWYHIKRLNRPKWLPPVFWVVGVGVVVVLVSLFFPAGMLPQGNLTQLPGPVTIDPIFLYYLPAREYPTLNWLLWGGLILFTLAISVLPWTRRRRRESGPSLDLDQSVQSGQPIVNIIKDRCSGCTVCALDCPYGAIEMVERNDGKRHKYIAIEDPGLCVSCGICVGSCDGVAVTMGNTPPSALWDTVALQLTLAKMKSPIDELQVVFTCERHAVHGARPYIEHSAENENGKLIEVIELPCVGSAPPDLLARTLDEGVANVHIIGCPADDCTNREGNIWLEQRITRERLPRLKRQYADAPITASWLPPDDFNLGIASIPSIEKESADGEAPAIDYMSLRQMNGDLTWRNYLVAFLLLALVLMIQVLLTDLAFSPYQDKDAAGQVVIADLAAPIGRTSYISSTLGPSMYLHLEVDGEVVVQDSLQTATVLNSSTHPYFEEFDLSVGNHQLRLSLTDPATATSFVYFDALVVVSEGDILTIPHPSG